MSLQSPHERTPPLLVEVTGVAGSGKSTISRALEASGFKKAEFIHTRHPKHLMQLVKSIPRLVPVVAAGVTGRGGFGWADFKLMVYVTRWREFLRNHPRYQSGVVLFDQGPIYALTRLEAKGLGVASTSTYRRWWDHMLAVWANELALVVWLDASDNSLLLRINDRSQDHIIKGTTKEASLRFIAHYRARFSDVLELVERSGTATVVRFDTSETKPTVLVEQIRNLIVSDVR